VLRFGASDYRIDEIRHRPGGDDGLMRSTLKRTFATRDHCRPHPGGLAPITSNAWFATNSI
jgi:hypothetical protein